MNKKELGFQNLYALLKFTVRDADVKKVTVKVNEGAYIAGDAKIQMVLNTELIGNEEGKPVFGNPVLSVVENGSNTITLTSENGFDTEATYYVAVVPTTIESIAVYFDENETPVNSKNVTMTLAANKIYNLKDLGAPKQERDLAFADATATATVGKDFTAPTLSGVTEGVMYESSNPAVAVVDATGKVTVKAVGETTITASAEESRYYLAGEASYTLTVKESAVIRINNKNGWGDLNITIKQGSTTLVDAKPMVDEGSNIFAYSLDPQYVGKEVTYYLEHSWYMTSAKTVTLAADSEAEAIVLNTTYLQPNDWNSDNPRYGAHIWVSGKSGIWVNATKVKDNFYEVEVPANGNYTNIIWCRMNPSNSTNEWASVWNQTGDLTLQHKCYCIQGKDAWNKPTGNYWY